MGRHYDCVVPANLHHRTERCRVFIIQVIARWRLDQIISFFLVLISCLGHHLHRYGELVAEYSLPSRRGYVVAGALFLAIMTLISIVDTGATFRLPLSRFLPVYLGFI